MTVPTFAARRKAWSSPPVDDIGYLPAADLLDMDDDQFIKVIDQAVTNRYSGWRNHRDNWTRILTRWDTTEGQRILDYGCGIGLEALILAKRNDVFLADISEGNLFVAQRALTLKGHEPAGSFLIADKPPFMQPAPQNLDVILCLGVLHHIPKPEPVVHAMHGWIREGGELRLMVYSDEAWRLSTGRPPPLRGKVEDDPDFELFWQTWDAVGGYADWYSRFKLEDWFGEWFTVTQCEPLTVGGEYLGAVLVKK
jgi:SAM-dependent methyltransferase